MRRRKSACRARKGSARRRRQTIASQLNCTQAWPGGERIVAALQPDQDRGLRRIVQQPEQRIAAAGPDLGPARDEIIAEMRADRPGPDQRPVAYFRRSASMPTHACSRSAMSRARDTPAPKRADRDELADVQHAEIIGFRHVDAGHGIDPMPKGDIVDEQRQRETRPPQAPGNPRQGESAAETEEPPIPSGDDNIGGTVKQRHRIADDLRQHDHADAAQQRTQQRRNARQ